MVKLCKLCDTPKPSSEFGSDKRRKSGLRYCCKSCRRREYKPEQKSVYNSQWYKDNKEHHLANIARYAAGNKDKLRVYKNEYDKKKAREDQGYKIKRALRARLRSAIRNSLKTGSAIKDLGCSVKELKIYLELKFQSGMSWDNYGIGKEKWQIDHIKPLLLFNLEDPEQVRQACHHTNLQPLWHKDHVLKTILDRRNA